MTLYVGPVETHDPSEFHPPGIIGNDWCHLVSKASALELTTFVTLNILTIGTIATNIRSPSIGSIVTYIALSASGRAAAIAAGCGVAPSDGKCYAQAFDAVFGSIPQWEP